jgi:hypothetical protein
MCNKKDSEMITCDESEWIDVSFRSNEPDMFQNKKCSALFKKNNDSRPYYIDAIIWRKQNGETLYGPVFDTYGKRISNSHYIKPLPFYPKSFYIDIVDEEDGSYVIKQSQLKEVFEYYDKRDYNE